jgi:hypothetical protein
MACSEEEDCSLNGRPMVTYNFYAVVPETGAQQAVQLAQLTVTAAETDSTLLNRGANVSTMSLPLRYTADSTQLILNYGEAYTKDTITLRHTNTPYFLSMDCGYQMKQVITGREFTRNQIDTIYISNPEAGIYGTENLKLIFRSN